MKIYSTRVNMTFSVFLRGVAAVLFVCMLLSIPLSAHVFAQNAGSSNCSNTLYAAQHPDQCSSLTSGNPYCQGDNCGVSAGIDRTREGIQGNISTTTDIRLLIFGWIQFFLGFIFLIAVVGIIYAGVLFVTSFGNDAGRQKATKLITATLIGIVIILIAYGLVNTIIQAVK